MTFFLDANVLIYSAVDSPRREPCIQVLRAIADGRATGRSSTAVLEEVWHIERSGRAGDLAGLAERAHAVLAPLLPVTDEAFARALELDARSLGTNDRVHAATCIEHGIRLLISADSDFDEVAAAGLHRVDPLDEAAIEAALESHG